MFGMRVSCNSFRMSVELQLCVHHGQRISRQHQEGAEEGIIHFRHPRNTNQPAAAAAAAERSAKLWHGREVLWKVLVFKNLFGVGQAHASMYSRRQALKVHIITNTTLTLPALLLSRCPSALCIWPAECCQESQQRLLH
jgi:hypothetical protein